MLFARDQLARMPLSGSPRSIRRSEAGEKLRGVEGHLGDRVADYVDGMLSPQEEYRADVHLTVCEHCRYAVQQERAIVAQLRSVSFDCGGHQQLMAGLLSLASSESDSRLGGPAVAPSRRPTAAPRSAPAVVTASAPPQYQSARKSMACALFAVAGCVGVALVASTGTGVAHGPQNPQQESDRASLVRNVQSPRPAQAAAHRKVSGTLTQDTPMFAPAAVRQAH